MGAAVAWAAAVVLFRLGGRDIPPLQLNLFKNTIGLALLALTWVVTGAGGAAWWDAVVLIASGVIGMAVADTLFLEALNRLGAARIAVVEAAYPLSVIALSMLFLGERYGPLQWLGAGLVIGALFLASEGGGEEEEDAAEDRRPWEGMALGLAGVALMGVGVVMAKVPLDHTPVVTASVLRLGGGQVSLVLWCLLRRSPCWGVLRPQRAWRYAAPGAVIGTWLAYLMWLGGVKYTDVSVASVLNQLSVVFIALFAVAFLRERLSWRTGLAVALGVVGAVLVALT